MVTGSSIGQQGNNGPPDHPTSFESLLGSYLSALASHESYLSEVGDFQSFYDTSPYSIGERMAYAPDLLSLIVSDQSGLCLADGVAIKDVGDIVQWTNCHFPQVYDPASDSGKDAFALLYKVHDVILNSYRLLNGSGKPVTTPKNLSLMWHSNLHQAFSSGFDANDDSELNDIW